MRSGFIAVCLALAACTEFPELDVAVPDSATKGPYPALLPMEQILAGPEPTVSEETLGNMQSRVAALKARASRLRRPVVDAPTRARMRRGVPRS